MPHLSSDLTSFAPKTFAVIHICSSMTSSSTTITSGAAAPKNTVESMGIIAHAAPQGTAHASAIVSTFCPQLSITRAPAAPPIVQPKLTRNGITDLPWSPSFPIVLSNT